MGRSNESKFVVLKFGGTSVASLKCWQTILDIAKKRIAEGFRPVLVCSAVAGVSDALERLIISVKNGSYEKEFRIIEDTHKKLADELSVDVSDVCLDQLRRLATGASLIGEVSPKTHAQIMSYGELISTRLGEAFLNKKGLKTKWMDAREFLQTINVKDVGERRNYLSASCSDDRDENLINKLSEEKNSAIITQGFIARNSLGDTVLLGRGGSDLSASYFAAKLRASHCEIWTDVPGMYTANPRLIASARLIRELDYDEAQEISTTGAKVLHPRCIAPVRHSGIPLYIFSLNHPDEKGTVISGKATNADAQIKAISVKKGITLVSMETVDMWHQVGFLADIFGCFKQNGLSVDLVSTSETNVSVSLDRMSNVLDAATMESLKNDLNKFCRVRIIDSCAVISLVGKNIRSILHCLGPAFELFEEQKIYLLSQASNDLNLTFVIDEDQAERMAEKLHEQLFRPYGDDKLLGATWNALQGKEKQDDVKTSDMWWSKRRDDLLKLANSKTPLYVYDEETISCAVERLKSIKSVDKIFYSIKANNNADMLNKVKDANLSFECVSPGEIEHILKLYPKIDRGRILFTPNFASKEDYEVGFAKGVIVTLDNQFPLRAWPEMFQGKEILIRMDPGQGRGHHKYVKTAGAKSKFGVSESQLDEVVDLTKKCGAKVIGLHAHVGSNIFKTDTWSETAVFLAKVAERFPDVRVLDLGGGLGVVEKPGREPLDLYSIDTELLKVRKAYPRFELWIEPGRYIVAEAGVLLAKVTQTKRKGDYYYIGVDAGMNTLIRPALYGAHHEIVNLSRLGSSDFVIANVVGPICETGDVLGYERRIATPEEGDIILIATAGAYGHVMGSSYNLREPAEELFLKVNS